MQFNYCKGIAHFVLLLIRVLLFSTKIVEKSENENEKEEKLAIKWNLWKMFCS